jgi:hypothetical protein
MQNELQRPRPTVADRGNGTRWARAIGIGLIVGAVAALAGVSWSKLHATAAIVEQTTPEFSGYATRLSGITSASMHWVEPRVSCVAGKATGVAIWVGVQDDAGQLQQIGTDSQCDPASGLRHLSWWEAYPASSEPLTLPAVSGHRMFAEISVRDGVWTYSLVDETSGTSAAIERRIHMEAKAAVWTVERDLCPADYSRICPLAEFTSVDIADASLTADGEVSGIVDSKGVPSRMSMVSGDNALATTGDLTSGDSFSITYRAAGEISKR